MPKINLRGMDVDALLKLQDDIDERLGQKHRELEEQLSRLGLGMRQVGPGKGRKGRASLLKGRKAPIKYRDKSGNVWAGRGAQPRWLTAAIKAGSKRDDFLVDKSARKHARKTRKAKRRKSRR
jgi:DNA-binding protein H-NS